MSPSIIFDFDGTLALGSGPVIDYARRVAPSARDGFLARVDDELAAFRAGPSRYRDGYDIVGSLARTDGVDAVALDRAYMASRQHLGTELAPVETMPELADFLGLLATRARLLLATNAPATGIDSVLTAWGVRELFAERLYQVGKPSGLLPVVRDALAHGPVLAIGDIVELDLDPALTLGADTALVGATAAHAPAQVTMRGRELADLRDDIQTWSATAASRSHHAHQRANTIER